jgi:hypothetical protein
LYKGVIVTFPCTNFILLGYISCTVGSIVNIWRALLCTLIRYHHCFIIKVCWIFSKAFSASVEGLRWFLCFLLFICCLTFILCICWTILHPCSETKLVRMYDLWCVVEFSLTLFCYEFLHLYSLQLLGL